MRCSRKQRTALGVGALLALVALGVWLDRRDPPALKIASLTPARNFSRVRVEGVLRDDAKRLREGDVLCWVEDETGAIAVFVEAPLEGTPRAGERVVATGYAQVGVGDERRIRVVERGAFERLSNAVVLAGEHGETARVSGSVSRVWEPPPGSNAPFRLTVRTKGGAVDVVHWLPDAQRFVVGERVEARGRVDVFRGEKRLKVFAENGLRSVQEP